MTWKMSTVLSNSRTAASYGSGLQSKLPNSWQTARLGNVATLQRGMDLPEHKRSPGSVPVYGSNGVSGFHDMASIKAPGVITGRSGSMGHVYYSDCSFWPLNTTLYVKDFHGNNERFIYYLLSNLRLERFAASTGVPSLNRNFVHPISVALPPLPEQRAIAAILDSIDQAIEATDALISATEQLRDSLLHNLLTRGLPGRHTEWKQVPGLGTIPASWEVARMGDVVDVQSGQANPMDPRYREYLFVAPDDIQSATGRLIKRRSVACARAISGKYEFDEHDVVYSKIRPYLMKVYLPQEFGLCSADMYPIRPRKDLLREYLALVLLTSAFTEYTRTCSDRTGIPKINRHDLLRYTLPLPPLPEQQAIAAILGSVDESIEKGRGAREGLRVLKESASDALLTGRVRVSVRDNAD